MSLNKKFLTRLLAVALLASGWCYWLMPKNKVAAEATSNEELHELIVQLQKDVWTLERNIAFSNTDVSALLPHLDELMKVGLEATASATPAFSEEEITPTNNWLANLGEQIWLPLQAIFFDEQAGILQWRLPQLFSERVEFSEEVELAGGVKVEHLKVSTTSSGQLTIPPGDTWRYHSFGRPFEHPPLVLLTPVSASGTATYQLASVTTAGFQVQLNQVATSSVTFNWLALESGD